MIPKVNFLGRAVSRLIVGDNPINGYSYVPSIASGEGMLDYYTEARVIDLLRYAEILGINAFMPLGNEFMIRAVRHFRNAGGSQDIIFQSYPPADFKLNLSQMAQLRPLGIYHQGTTTDALCEEGRFSVLRERIKMIKDEGIYAGLGTHVPEFIMRAEDEDWGVDFYAACLHNSRKRSAEDSELKIDGTSTIKFFMEDRPLMLQTIAAINKPVIAFKLFAGGQVFLNKPKDQIPSVIASVFKEVYSAIKPNDIAAVGIYQRDGDQLGQCAAAMEPC